MLALLADDLMAGGMGDQVGEPLHRHGVAVPHVGLHGLGKRQKTRHTIKSRLDRGYLRGKPSQGQMLHLTSAGQPCHRIAPPLVPDAMQRSEAAVHR